MILQIFTSFLNGFIILMIGIIILFIIDIYIQKKRKKYYSKKGYSVFINIGFFIEKDKNGKIKIYT